MERTHLLLVGIDGLRLDRVDAEVAPHLAALVAGGPVTTMTMPVPTISGPGWATLLTGASHAEHGVTDNTFVGSRLDAIPDLLSRAFAADPSRTTFAAGSWPPLVDPSGVGPVIQTRDAQRRAERHRVIVRDGETYGYRAADAEIATYAVAGILGAGPDVSFVYLGAVDEAGHLFGSVGAEYRKAIRSTDAHLGRLLAAVERRAAAGERWLVAVTTDHGHLDEGGHGGGEPQVTASFVLRRGYGVEPVAWPDRIDPTELTPRLLGALPTRAIVRC